MPRRRTGSPEDSLRQRLEMGIHKDLATGCWTWTKGCDPKGYPRIRHLDNVLYGYRASLFLYRQIPLGAKVSCKISCGNRKCVNPDHIHVDDPK